MGKSSGKTLTHTTDCVKCTDFIHGKPHYKVQNMLRNLFSSLFDFNSRKDLENEHDEEKVAAAPVQKNSVPAKNSVITDDRFSADIDCLKEKYTLSVGSSIETNLKDLLEICPRTRRRIDAYNGLVKYLRENYDVCLTIKSQKTK